MIPVFLVGCAAGLPPANHNGPNHTEPVVQQPDFDAGTRFLEFEPAGNGLVPVWLVAGPFNQPHVGFGTPADFDPVGEASLAAVWDDTWKPQQPNPAAFLDFNEILGWKVDTQEPEMIWQARAAYATTIVESAEGGSATLYVGGNSRIKVLVNGVVVLFRDFDENARPDAQAVPVSLLPGKNSITIRATQSHMNYNIVIFDELRYDWGFFARIEAPSQDLKFTLPAGDLPSEPIVNGHSTFFYKDGSGGQVQRHDFKIESPFAAEGLKMELTLSSGAVISQNVSLPAGISRHVFWVPELKEPETATLSLKTDQNEYRYPAVLEPAPKYELHLVFLSHTDIGYTHTQPVVRELHMRILDDVVELCGQDPDFKWTIETVWMLEAYYQGRTSAQFEKLAELIREGRVAVSPVYTNPFTGMVSEEEMIRSLDRARYFADRIGFEFSAAVYNDVPGQSWFLPQLLSQAGVRFLANGLNEVYGGYRLQQELPKIMYWEGDDGSRLLHYRTESYNEAMAYGLERGNDAIQHRIWQRIRKLEAGGYPASVIMLNSAFGDNLGISRRQWASHKVWNSEFAWPRFLPSTADQFSDELHAQLPAEMVPVVRGDATSDWDIYFQGEPERMIRYRRTQHKLYAAENLAIASAWMSPGANTMAESIERAYRLQQHFSGHGSGLEYGYGSEEENERAFGHRENYVAGALAEALEAWERSAFRYVYPLSSLDGEFVAVVNPHGHTVTGLVEAGLKPVWAEQYGVLDPETGKCLPSVITDHVLRFVAEDVPGLGWKKYPLVPPCSPDLDRSELAHGPNFIENRYFRVETDPASGSLVSVFNKELQLELMTKPGSFAGMHVQTGGRDEAFLPVQPGHAEINIVDESPIRITLIQRWSDDLVPEVRITLYEHVSDIDVRVAVDLTRLVPSAQPQAFAIAFPRLNNARILAETLGGFLDGQHDRIPGLASDAFSIRRTILSSNEKATLHIGSPDARVHFTTDDLILSNVVNNFPENWNRREPNDQVLNIHYRLGLYPGGVNYGRTARFGRETASPMIPVRGWFANEPAQFAGLETHSDHVVLQAVKALGGDLREGFLIRFRNADPNENRSLRITAPWLSQGEVSRTNWFGDTEELLRLTDGAVEYQLKPNQTLTLKWIQTKQ